MDVKWAKLRGFEKEWKKIVGDSGWRRKSKSIVLASFAAFHTKKNAWFCCYCFSFSLRNYNLCNIFLLFALNQFSSSFVFFRVDLHCTIIIIIYTKNEWFVFFLSQIKMHFIISKIYQVEIGDRWKKENKRKCKFKINVWICFHSPKIIYINAKLTRIALCAAHEYELGIPA